MLIGIDGNEANVKNRVGSNEYAFELIKKLWGLGDKHEWLVYLRNKPLDDMPKEKENWHYKVCGPKKFWTQFALPLNLFFSKKRPNVFFSPGHYSPGWSPVPVVASIMDLGYLKFPDQFTKKDFYQLKNWTAKTIRTAKYLMTISESTKNDIINYYHVRENKIIVTYPGFDEERFNSKISPNYIEQVKRKFGIDSKYVLFLGTLKPSKNIEGLLEAFRILLDRFGVKETKLVIAGKKGWLFEKIFNKVESLGLKDKVIFTNFIESEEVPALLSGAEVFVLPSFWEGFGIPVLEAMACGTPVVVSNIASLPEVVGQAGNLVDPKDPGNIALGIKKAFEERNELSRLSLKQSGNFSWEDCAVKTLAVLEKTS